MTRLFARHGGRHCARGSLTGWSALASVSSAVEDFTRRRRLPVPLAPFPMADMGLYLAAATPADPLKDAS